MAKRPPRRLQRKRGRLHQPQRGRRRAPPTRTYRTRSRTDGIATTDGSPDQNESAVQTTRQIARGDGLRRDAAGVGRGRLVGLSIADIAEGGGRRGGKGGRGCG